MTLRAIYDDGIPISGDFSQPDHYFVCYDHATPLQSPLRMEVSFGPYAVSVGSGGEAASYYWIDLFDVIEPYPNFPDISEAIGINIEVSPGSVVLQAPRVSTISSCTASITACEISTAKTSWLARRSQRGFQNSIGKTSC